MIIKTLVEDTTSKNNLRSEHGLSLYIETSGKKILFDSGTSGLFMENAIKMGIDISKIDYAIISHGHNDHGGGLERFFEANSKAEVFIHESAFDKHYSLRNGSMVYIGLDEKLRKNERIVYVKGRFFICKGIELFSDAKTTMPLPVANSNLYTEYKGKIIPDDFSHELYLTTAEESRHFLLTGCTHNGIMNIMEHYREMKGYMPQIIIGGLHLQSRTYTPRKDDVFMKELSDYMIKSQTVFYTCHCTGKDAFDILKQDLKNKIHYLCTGDEINI
ncbi:MAG: ribonuclease Z [Firmicutes bacterium ADurb.Bin146]|nr:MAG: ribonuclease Z [Firmicutes bacterium ADurb.Bin146]